MNFSEWSPTSPCVVRSSSSSRWETYLQTVLDRQWDFANTANFFPDPMHLTANLLFVLRASRRAITINSRCGSSEKHRSGQTRDRYPITQGGTALIFGVGRNACLVKTGGNRNRMEAKLIWTAGSGKTTGENGPFHPVSSDRKRLISITPATRTPGVIILNA